MKYGLCVGINDYPGSGSDLSGCVNDATDWRDALNIRGYQTATLFDREATKVNMMEALRENIARLRYQDTLVFTYSGHGSYIPDTNGDEPDGRDEVLVPHDYQDGNWLSDDELYDLCSVRAYGTRIFIFSDSCFSGSVSRFADIEEDDSIDGPTGRPSVVRFMPPAHFLDGSLLEAARKVEDLKAKGLSRTGAVLVSGCSDIEYSYDAWFGSRPNGAFSRVAIDRLNSSSPTTVKSWFDSIRQILPNADYPQTPQLTASYHQKSWMI